MEYSIFRAPLFAFYSKQFYRDTAMKGKGFGFLYLFVLLLICNSLSVASGYFHIVESIKSAESVAIYEQMPDMKLKDGRFSINKTSPYKVQFKNILTREPKLIVFDTSGSASEMGDADLLITEQGFRFVSNDKPIPWFQGFDFDMPAGNLKGFLLDVALKLLIFGILIVPLVYLGHIILALIYAAVALIIDSKKLGFKTAIRMSIVAMTPSMVLTSLFYLLFCKPELWELFTVPISIAYLVFGYNCLRSEFVSAENVAR
ncbi:MAG: DUF1189 domain-containing protein [Candidatus Obscuribacterales bacterium]|nr:DUF1189 domain-containing protein [Candidatus Obscuribacterales bacterium]